MDYLFLTRQSQSLVEDSLALISQNSESVHRALFQMEKSLQALERSEEHLATVERHQSSSGAGPF